MCGLPPAVLHFKKVPPPFTRGSFFVLELKEAVQPLEGPSINYFCIEGGRGLPKQGRT